ncbi:hypothetical protein SDC9_158724 [bioreactor metagenome]|uniref:Uncharacterized protein n=1 Tax=bioreactor metagenome TaxID=1076179 RepID=A0A645FGC6_9ZZZZ
MERHHTQLEADARHQENQAEQQHRAVCRLVVDSLRHAGELERTGGAIHHRHAIQQQAGSQRAQHEILHAGFGGARGIAIESNQRIQRERHHLQADVHRQHVVGGDHHHHAQRHQHGQQVILRLVDVAVGKVAASVQQRDRHGEVDHQLQEVAHQVADEHVAEGVADLTIHGEDGDEGRRDQCDLRQCVAERTGDPAGKGGCQHDHERHHGDEDLGRCGVEVGDNKVHLLTSPFKCLARSLRACSRQHAAGVLPPRHASLR